MKQSVRPPFACVGVAEVFAAYPPAIRKQLLELRQLIFDTAASIEAVGPLEETLKWGEPAYLSSKRKTGSTIRLGYKVARPDELAMYFNCQTNLIETFRTMFPKELKFVGNRAILFVAGDTLPKDALVFCIGASLTYHRR
jgi:Domain of unknown function (DU1801)